MKQSRFPFPSKQVNLTNWFNFLEEKDLKRVCKGSQTWVKGNKLEMKMTMMIVWIFRAFASGLSWRHLDNLTFKKYSLVHPNVLVTSS